MAGYSTQEEITVADYRGAQHPDRLIDEVEERVRRTLEGAPHVEGESVPTGDVMIGWVALARGRFRAWTPGEELPEDVDRLSCRGRRYA